MSFIGELKRRNVVKVAAFYLVAAWLILQVAELLFSTLELPASFVKTVLAILILGLPLVLIFSWVYEVTPDGIKREKDIDRSQSITAETGQRLNIVIIALLVLAIAFMAFDRLVPEKAAPVAVEASEIIEPEEEAVDDRSIAVLPFRDMSPEGNQEYFSDGIAEEILNVLVRVDDLSVASRTTSFGFKGQESLGIPYMAEKMKVRHVLEGSVRKSGDAVRITAQLIDATDDKHLWSDTYDRTLSAESIFEIQDDIAQAIVAALGVVMEGDDSVQSRADTQNLDAYELYLEANQLFLSRTDLRRSKELFEQAVSLDPQFARAWAGLSAVTAVSPSWGIGGQDYYAISNEAANRAIEIDDTLALPYAVLSLAETNQLPVDWERTQVLLEKSLARNSKEATTFLWRGMNFMRVGFFDKALVDLGQCLELDPDYELCRRHLANTMYFMGDEARALELYEEGLIKGFTGGDEALLAILAHRGDRLAYSLATAFANNGAGEQALTEFDIRASFDPDYDFKKERAAIEAAYEKASGKPLDWSLHPSAWYRYRNYEEVNLPLTPIWWYRYPDEWYESDHRRRMIIETGLPAYWRTHGFPSHCNPVGDDDFECDIRRLGQKPRGGVVN